MIITQDQINACLQPIRILHIQVDLLNSSFAIINSLSGKSTDGSISFAINTANRRTGSLTMIAENNSLFPVKGSNIWFNNMVKITIKLEYMGDLTPYNQGIFLVKDCTFSYANDGSKIASFTLVDLMSNLNGDLGGNLTNETRLLAQSTNITTAIIATLTSNLIGRFNINSIKINDNQDALIPYDLTQTPNSNIYALIKQLNDLYMGTEFFYSEDGYFTLQKIPTLISDAIAFDFTGINISSSYENKMDFSLVKNCMYRWGRILDSGEQIYGVYRNTFSTTTYVEMVSISTKIDGDICYIINENLSYVWNTLTSVWTVLDFNVNPTYNVTNIGEKKDVISDTNIYTNEQALLNCQYSLFLNNTFGQTITISVIPLYFLDINKKIHMNLPEKNIVGDYRITKISTPLKIDQEMQIEMVQIFY